MNDTPPLELQDIRVDRITVNPAQPRRVFDEDSLAELQASIREVGLLQPVVVRPKVQEQGWFELVAGERRLRSVVALGWDRVPAVVRQTEDGQLLRVALLENLQRVALNPLEEAAAYEQLIADFGCTQEELARQLGRSRPQVTNTLRLLKLPPAVQRRVAAGVLSQGHARALLALPDAAAMDEMAQRVVAEGLSVRNVEELVSVGQAAVVRRRQPRQPERLDLSTYADTMADRLDTRVSLSLGRSRGRLVIEFADVEDLDRIMTTLAPGWGHTGHDPVTR